MMHQQWQLASINSKFLGWSHAWKHFLSLLPYKDSPKEAHLFFQLSRSLDKYFQLFSIQLGFKDNISIPLPWWQSPFRVQNHGWSTEPSLISNAMQHTFCFMISPHLSPKPMVIWGWVHTHTASTAAVLRLVGLFHCWCPSSGGKNFEGSPVQPPVQSSWSSA